MINVAVAVLLGTSGRNNDTLLLLAAIQTTIHFTLTVYVWFSPAPLANINLLIQAIIVNWVNKQYFNVPMKGHSGEWMSLSCG